MNERPPHLHESVLKELELSDEDRIERVQSEIWIGYPQAAEILNKLEDLLTYPKSHRMPNLLIVGDTNNGKTMLIHRFHSFHPSHDNPEGEGIVVPVMVIQAPPVPDENRLYASILDKLFASYSSHSRTEKKQFQVIKLLRDNRLKMLVIDEIHHILAGNLNKQRAFLNVIKFLGNELQIPIVGIGTKDAFQAIQAEPQLSNRFEPVLLPRWQLDERFFSLLCSFEALVPLRKPTSFIEHPNLMTRLYDMSEGYIGELARILKKAAERAIVSGVEKITEKILDEIRWVTPSDRKRQSLFLT